MRHLATFADLRTAKAVSDYLQTQDISNEISPDDKGWSLFIVEEEQFEQAQLELGAFVNNPYDQKYLDASWIRSQNAQVYPNSSTRSKLLQQIWRDTGIVTRLVAAAVVVIFALQVFGYHPWIYQYLGFPVTLASLDFIEIYRLITPAFMHGSIEHMLFNLFWWIWLGGKLETAKGGHSIVNLFLLSALAAHLLQFSLENASFLGLSGVVYGLLGYAWLSRKLGKLKLYIPDGVFIMMLLWLVVGFADVLPMQMANWAHLGGMLGGMAWAWLEKPTERTN